MDYDYLEMEEFLQNEIAKAFEKYLDKPVERIDLYQAGDGQIVLEINGNGLEITIGQLLKLADKASPIIWDIQMEEEDNNRRQAEGLYSGAHDEWMN